MENFAISLALRLHQKPLNHVKVKKNCKDFSPKKRLFSVRTMKIQILLLQLSSGMNIIESLVEFCSYIYLSSPKIMSFV